MEKCIICGIELEENEGDICKVSFCFLLEKYPQRKKFKEVIEWHKDSLEEVEEA